MESPQPSSSERNFTADEEPRRQGTKSEGKQTLTKRIRIDDLRRYFHLPIVEVARQLRVCTTLFKRICRNNNIKKWPYRQVFELLELSNTYPKLICFKKRFAVLQKVFRALRWLP